MWIPANKVAPPGASQLPVLYFFYTRRCGTCLVVRKMLEVVMRSGGGIDIIDCPVETTQRLVQAWQITGVPCLVAARGEHAENRLYEFQSVQDVMRFIQHHRAD